jgi:hypothetical protein
MNPDPLLPFVAFCALAGVVFGIILIRRGFANLKTRRFVESLPPSRIRSMALGPVEVNGVIGPGLEVPDPVYQRPCVYYGLTVEHRVLTMEDGSLTYKWITLLDEGSGLRPFWLVDPTAQTLVWAPGAELRYAANHNFTCGFFGSLFGRSAEFEFVRRVKKQRVLMRRVRLNMRVLRPGTPLFVVGCAVTPATFPPPDARFADALREAAALDRGRVIVRGDGPFVIARSVPQVTERRAGMFMHVAIGFALIAVSLLTLGFFWQLGVP